MKNTLKMAVTLTLLIWITSHILYADDLPEGKRARGKSDPVLSGISVYRGTITKAIAMLGQPTRIVDIPDSADVAGGRDYIWESSTIKIEIGTWKDNGSSSVPYSVEVWGNKPNNGVGSTSRGLKLGEKISDIIRIYGTHYEMSRLDIDRVQVILQWNDETTLYVYIDKTGRINHMHLQAATE